MQHMKNLLHVQCSSAAVKGITQWNGFPESGKKAEGLVIKAFKNTIENTIMGRGNQS